MRPDEIPGLAEHAHDVWTPEHMLALRQAFAELADAGRAGERRRVLFVIPPNNKCAGPLYEIVLMLETWLRRERARDSVEIAWSTFESSYIQAFGPRLHEMVTKEFERRGIAGRTSRVVERVEAGEVGFADGGGERYDLLVSFPPYVAGTVFAGLPADERGFLITDPDSRQVADRIWAAGDAGDFPVKQAFLAFLQADVVASRIAAEALGIGSEESFDPVSMCVMEQFDKATYAKVPLRITGDPDHPVEVRPGAGADYRVGSSVAWRGGKKLLGLSVPWRFRHGRPFHAGPFWSGMELGLKGMSSVLASGAR
jgi:sulfide:quinone oxidoreductase